MAFNIAIIVLLAAGQSFGLTFPGFAPSADPDIHKNVSQLIFAVEEYKVITTDGYILRLQRIPHGRKEEQAMTSVEKPVAFLMHGLLGSSADFVINFPTQSLGFILADAGYYVWLRNFRGNTYTSHVSLSQEDSEFWKFSTDEMISYDLPAMLDAVLNITGKQKLHYVGWSQGAETLFGLLFEKPEYNSKISLFSAMAPAVYVGEVGGLLRLFSTPLLQNLAAVIGNGQVFLSSQILTPAADLICGNVWTNFVCTGILNILVDVDTHQINKVTKPLACALDVLQGDEKMHTGHVLPTLSAFVKRIEYEIMSGLTYCRPFAGSMLDGVHKRFGPMMQKKELLVTAASLSKFKLAWIREETRQNEVLGHVKDELLSSSAPEDPEATDTTGSRGHRQKDEDEFFSF